MDKLDFNFRKSRSLDTLFGDYIYLFKRIFKHFNSNIFQFILPVIAIFIVLVFFTFSLGSEVFYNSNVADNAAFGIIIGSAVILALFYFMLIPSFGIEYMFLLEEKGNTDFKVKDIAKRIKSHLGKYIVFFLASLVVAIIIAIPVGIAFFVLALIPILGAFATGILMACIIVVFSCALFLYLTGREKVFASFTAAFRLIKKKFFIYGITAYLFQLMVQIILGILTFIPLIIIFIIAFNTIGFHHQWKEIATSFGGRFAISIGASILLIFITLASIYLYSFYVLIFFSSLEDSKKEGTIEMIETIGSNENKDNEQPEI